MTTTTTTTATTCCRRSGPKRKSSSSSRSDSRASSSTTIAAPHRSSSEKRPPPPFPRRLDPLRHDGHHQSLADRRRLRSLLTSAALFLFSLVAVLCAFSSSSSLVQPAAAAPVVLGLNAFPLPNVDVTSFANVHVLHDEDEATVTLYWTLLDANTPTELLHALIVMNVSAVAGQSLDDLAAGSMPNAWVGIAFGPTMLAADFVLVHAEKSGTAPIYNLMSQGIYDGPVSNTGNIEIFLDGDHGGVAHVAYHSSTLLVGEIRRYTTPQQGDSAHATIHCTPGGPPADLLWAFNVHPTPTASQPWKVWHGDHHRGAFKINFASGVGNPAPTSAVSDKVVHGSLMISAWLVMFPLGIFWSRYARSWSSLNKGWMWVHIGVQSTGAVVVFISMLFKRFTNPVYVSPTTPPFFLMNYPPHQILGYTLIFLLVFQVFMGVFNRLSLSVASIDPYRELFHLVHTWGGRLLAMTAVVQMFLGIDMLYPFEDITDFDRGLGMWVVLILLLIVCVVGLVGMEAYWLLRVKRIDKGGWMKLRSFGPEALDWSSSSKDGGGAGGAKRFVGGWTGSLPTFYSTGPKAGSVSSSEYELPTKSYTWKDIDAATSQGNLLVVANGKYVYDVNKWIYSHPGGQIILKSVAGTDITHDFFFEAGVDAESFAKRPSKRMTRANLQSQLPKVSTQRLSVYYAGTAAGISQARRAAGLNASTKRVSMSIEQNLFPLLTEEEWKWVVKARRTHSHTRLAVQTLTKLQVGLLENDEEALDNDGGATNHWPAGTLSTVNSASANTQFSPWEYRRYALVDLTLESSEPSQVPTYRLKFCLLYPHSSIRQNTPCHFEPGQHVEIQLPGTAGANGRGDGPVSRYYTPVSGDPRCFEVLVKLRPGGVLTPRLLAMKEGERQVKIRGPFMAPTVPAPVLVTPEDMGSAAAAALAGPGAKRAWWDIERVLFLCAGSGLAPAVHLMSHVMLPVDVPVYVVQDYEPTHVDELELKEGDWVTPKHHFLDGWAFGVRESTGQEGLFPLPITLPRSSTSSTATSTATAPPATSPRITILSSQRTLPDCFGLTTLEAALQAHPHHARLTTYITRPERDDLDEATGGAFRCGRIGREALAEAAGHWVGGSSGGKVVVCGPSDFMGAMYELLVDEIGVEHADIILLSDNI
ncbi:hypothetical protein DFJ73DRAFT_767099 [Zopfochytrium polystomum]|nr:hypothetical protein DFJ73DRAFT_767099 [Zopfochytrium polystomum]